MKARIGFAGAIAAALAAAALPAQAQQQQGNAMPPGDGRDLVAVTCTQCHALTTVLQLRESADGWRSLVDYMVLHGAQLTQSESETAVQYLATNFGPGINVPKPETSVTLPDGQGKDLVETRCVVCHGLDHITAAKRSPSDWDSVLSRMVFLGAPVSADEKKSIEAYLDAKFGAK